MVSGAIPFRVGEMPFDRDIGRGECDDLVPVIGWFRQAVPGFDEIEDLCFFDPDGFIQLVYKHQPDHDVISDTAQQQGQYAGKDIYTAVFGKEFHCCLDNSVVYRQIYENESSYRLPGQIFEKSLEQAEWIKMQMRHH